MPLPVLKSVPPSRHPGAEYQFIHAGRQIMYYNVVCKKYVSNSTVGCKDKFAVHKAFAYIMKGNLCRRKSICLRSRVMYRPHMKVDLHV